MRSQQERASDRQAEIDALRAKRYQEESDRKQRARELAEAQKRADTQREMSQYREAQLYVCAPISDSCPILVLTEHTVPAV